MNFSLKWVVVKYNGVPLPFRLQNGLGAWAGAQLAWDAAAAGGLVQVTWVSVRADLGAGSPWADFVRHHAVVGVHRKGDVAVRADLGAGSPWADFVIHHAVVGVQRKHALVPRWPSKCSAR